MAILTSNLLCAYFCSELWDMKQVHSGIYEICLLKNFKSYLYDNSVPVLWQRGLFTMTTWTCSSPNWFPINRLTSHLVNFSVVTYMTLYPGHWSHGAGGYLDMKTISVSLALCWGNPLVTSGFPSQRASDAETLMFYLLLALTSCGTNSWVTHDLRCHITHVTVIEMRIILVGMGIHIIYSICIPITTCDVLENTTTLIHSFRDPIDGWEQGFSNCSVLAMEASHFYAKSSRWSIYLF